METTIGVNILCKTAKEQFLFLEAKNGQEYYKDYFSRIGFKEIIDKYYFLYYGINCKHHFNSDGTVLNAIIIEIHNEKGFNKNALKSELKLYIENYFNDLFGKFKN